MGMTGRHDIGKVGREACLPRVVNTRNTAARETLPPSERVCPWGHDLAPGASGASRVLGAAVYTTRVLPGDVVKCRVASRGTSQPRGLAVDPSWINVYIYKIGQQFPCQNHTKRTSSPRVLTAEALRRLAPEIRCWLRKRRPPPCRRRPRRRALARGPARRLPGLGEQSGSANPSPPTGPRGGHGGPSPARGRDGVTRRPGVGVATMDRGPCGFAVVLQPPQTRRGGRGAAGAGARRGGAKCPASRRGPAGGGAGASLAWPMT